MSESTSRGTQTDNVDNASWKPPSHPSPKGKTCSVKQEREKAKQINRFQGFPISDEDMLRLGEQYQRRLRAKWDEGYIDSHTIKQSFDFELARQTYDTETRELSLSTALNSMKIDKQLESTDSTAVDPSVDTKKMDKA
ncbi:hypothetical protein N7490_005756 [Penicillium lividum]|nr:hypothetical protein N7490_005756 [Penicillium lividum]